MSRRRCLICKKLLPPAAEPGPYEPFCSRRCQLVDLGVWLEEGYSIPAESDSSQASSRESDPPASDDPS